MVLVGLIILINLLLTVAHQVKSRSFLRPVPVPVKRQPTIFVGSTDISNKSVSFAEASAIPKGIPTAPTDETYLLLAENGYFLLAENGDNLEKQY